MKIILITALALLNLSAVHSSAADKCIDHKKAKAYPLASCIVSGEALDCKGKGKACSVTHQGQEVKVCCKDCLKEFKKAPAKYIGKIEKPATPKS